jgi:hypothetical protein
MRLLFALLLKLIRASVSWCELDYDFAFLAVKFAGDESDGEGSAVPDLSGMVALMKAKEEEVAAGKAKLQEASTKLKEAEDKLKVCATVMYAVRSLLYNCVICAMWLLKEADSERTVSSCVLSK